MRPNTIATIIILTFSLNAGEGWAQTKFETIHGFEPHFVLPDGQSRMLNIKTDFGAVGDGITDDSQAFDSAFSYNSPRAIYIPSGTYLIRQQLRFGVKDAKKKKVCIIGESRSSTILKLADGTSGFGDPGNPKAFIHARHPNQPGEQNFNNYFYHLTIEIGKNNPGAIALNYHTNNSGAIKDVTVKASDPVNHKGHAGIVTSEWNVGPGNGRFISVDGFTTGMDVSAAGNYFVLEHITVDNCGVAVKGGTCSIRGLTTHNCEVGLESLASTVLIDSDLSGSGLNAIENKATRLFVRNVTTSGFTNSINSPSPNGSVSASDVDFYISHKGLSGWPNGDTTLNLAIEESPEIQYPQSSADWALMPAIGDLSDTLQRAIDAGVRNIYIPGGAGTRITKTVYLRNKLQRIMGLGNVYIRYNTGPDPAFVLQDGTGNTVIIELIYSDGAASAEHIIAHASSRTLAFRHGSGSYITWPQGQGARVFIESLVGDPYHFYGVDAWVRDINTETGGPNHPNITNDGGTLWVFGQKTEDFATKLQTLNGGYTELLGGRFRQNWDLSDFSRSGIDPNDPPPLFLIENAHANLTYVTSDEWGVLYDPPVREVRGPETRELSRAVVGAGTVLYTGFKGTPGNTTELLELTDLTATAISFSKIDLQWQDPNTATSHYNIYRDTEPIVNTSGFNRIASSVTGTSYSDSDLGSLTTYYYKVTAVDTLFLETSGVNASAETFNGPPATPTVLLASTLASDRIALQWKDNSANEEGFKIERKEGPDGTYSEVANVGADEVSYTDEGLLAATEYYYRVLAYNAVGNSSFSNESSATTPAGGNAIFLGIVNNSFETGDFTGWTVTGGNNKSGVRTGVDGKSPDGASDGSYFVWGRQEGCNGDNPAGVTQLIDVSASASQIDADTIKVTLSAWGSGEGVGGDFAQMQIRFLDTTVDGNQIGDTQLSNKAEILSTWSQMQIVNVAVPVGTRSIEVYLLTERTGGSCTDAAFDNVIGYLTGPGGLSTPKAPAGLEATSISGGQIDLAWTDNSTDEQGFILERKTTADFEQLTVLDPDVTSYSDVGLAETTQAAYRVAAFNLAGNSEYSNTANAVTWINAPTDLQVTALSETEIDITWEDNSDAETGYIIESRQTADFIEITKTAADATGYLWTGLIENTNYELRVAAFNAIDTSDYSNIASAITLVTGLGKGDSYQELVLYPNPAGGIIYIHAVGQIDHVELYSLRGKLIPQGRFNMEKAELNVHDLARGMYIVKIYTDGSKVWVRKIDLE